MQDEYGEPRDFDEEMRMSVGYILHDEFCGHWKDKHVFGYLRSVVLYMYCLSGCKVTSSWLECLIIVLGRTTALRSS